MANPEQIVRNASQAEACAGALIALIEHEFRVHVASDEAMDI